MRVTSGVLPSRQRRAGAIFVALALVSCWAQSNLVTVDAHSAPRHAAAPYDINGDSFGDVVVTDGFATVSGKEWAGAIRVAFGSASGLTGRVQKVTQDSPGIKGKVRPGRQFGQSAISADFDADGYADIAGQQYDNIHVVYGGPKGLTGRDQRFAMADRLPEFSLLGPTLATGDFDHDGFADLVTSSPGSEDIKGALLVLRGSPRGLTIRGAVRLSRDTPGVAGEGFIDDFFGAELGVGDVNGDGIDDLALTSQEPETNGSVYVFLGSARGLRSTGHTYRLADDVFGQWALPVNNQTVLTVADLDRDGFGDLVLGSPEACPLGTEMDGCGVVGVLPGAATGVASTRAYLWNQDTPGVPGDTRSADWFGRRIAAGDLDQDGYIDLALAATGMDVGRVRGAGAVIVVYGGPHGLNYARSQVWSQGTRKIKGKPVRDDGFGNDGLRIANIGRGTTPDLLINTHADRERTGRRARTVQATNVVFSSPRGLTTSDQRWTSPQSDGT